MDDDGADSFVRIEVKFEGDLPAFAGKMGEAIRRGAMRGAIRFQTRAKLAFRADVRGAGLGDRLANTWQDKLYPEGRKQSWHPAVLIFSKAPEIIQAHTQGVTIKSKSGRYLAIPTSNVAKSLGRGGRKLTPRTIEAQFRQKLVFIPGRGGNILAFATTRTGKTGRLRSGITKSGRTSKGAEMTLMFVLVRQVTLRKRLNWPKLASDLAPVFREYLATEIANATAQ